MTRRCKCGRVVTTPRSRQCDDCTPWYKATPLEPDLPGAITHDCVNLFIRNMIRKPA